MRILPCMLMVLEVANVASNVVVVVGGVLPSRIYILIVGVPVPEWVAVVGL